MCPQDAAADPTLVYASVGWMGVENTSDIRNLLCKALIAFSSQGNVSKEKLKKLSSIDGLKMDEEFAPALYRDVQYLLKGNGPKAACAIVDMFRAILPAEAIHPIVVNEMRYARLSGLSAVCIILDCLNSFRDFPWSLFIPGVTQTIVALDVKREGATVSVQATPDAAIVTDEGFVTGDTIGEYDAQFLTVLREQSIIWTEEVLRMRTHPYRGFSDEPGIGHRIVDLTYLAKKLKQLAGGDRHVSKYVGGASSSYSTFADSMVAGYVRARGRGRYHC